MSGFENWPAPILRRWLLSAAAGPVIFLIGLAGRIALHDQTLLTLSTLLASRMVVRCIRICGRIALLHRSAEALCSPTVHTGKQKSFSENKRRKQT